MPPRRRSGSRQSSATREEQAEKSAEEMTEPVETEQIPEEREEWFRTPGFQRMKTAWEGDDAQQMNRLKGAIQARVFDTFPEAFALMQDLYIIVREPVADPKTGEVKLDADGFPVWRRNESTGRYLEDWTLLSIKQRENFLLEIVSNLVEWEQRAADLWTEAMFSKAMFTEEYAIEFDKPISGTIEDRNANANTQAAEARYFALMNAAVSRKADALIRTLTALQLRLRDSMA